MKKLIFAMFASFFASLSSCSAGEFKSVNPDEFEKFIADSTVQVLDVRTPDEFAEAHLPNAINIDVLNSNFKSAAIASLDMERPVAVYCRSGRRSKDAANILSQEGFSITELDKGFLAWDAARKPSVR